MTTASTVPGWGWAALRLPFVEHANFAARPHYGLFRLDVVEEVVAVRRRERTYFFRGVFAKGDGKARDQIRRAVERLSW